MQSLCRTGIVRYGDIQCLQFRRLGAIVDFPDIDIYRPIPIRNTCYYPLSLLLRRAFFALLFPQGPVASVFWLDEALESALRLDSIVTLVDAKNFLRQLQRVPEEGGGAGSAGDEQSAERPQNEAAMQVAYADRVLINKVCRLSWCSSSSVRLRKGPVEHERRVCDQLQHEVFAYCLYQRALWTKAKQLSCLPQPSDPCAPLCLP